MLFARYTSPMQAFILAGGFATRLWPITERRAKPLLPLKGIPLLTYAVKAIPNNVPVSVSTNAVFGDDMKQWAKTMERKISIIIEDAGHEGEKTGALGAVAKWLTEENIDDDVLLIAGDNYIAADMGKFLSLARGRPLIAAHDIGDFSLASQFGTVITGKDPADQNRIIVTSFEEKPLHPKSTFISAGWWWLPRSSFGILKEYAKTHPDNIGGVFEEFVRKGTGVDCFVFAELWKDIGSFESYLHLHREIMGSEQLIERDSRVSPDSVLKGSIAIGKKTDVTKSTLVDCIIFGNTTINDCVLERCIIDENCQLDGVDLTDQMLREGTVLRAGKK